MGRQARPHNDDVRARRECMAILARDLGRDPAKARPEGMGAGDMTKHDDNDDARQLWMLAAMLAILGGVLAGLALEWWRL